MTLLIAPAPQSWTHWHRGQGVLQWFLSHKWLPLSCLRATIRDRGHQRTRGTGDHSHNTNIQGWRQKTTLASTVGSQDGFAILGLHSAL